MKKGTVEKALFAWLADRLLMGVAVNIGKYVKSIATTKDPEIILLCMKLEKI